MKVHRLKPTADNGTKPFGPRQSPEGTLCFTLPSASADGPSSRPASPFSLAHSPSARRSLHNANTGQERLTEGDALWMMAGVSKHLTDMWTRTESNTYSGSPSM